MSQVIESLEGARDAASRQAWRDAYTAFSAVAAGELAPSDLESFGESAWWSGKLDEAISLRERAYAGYTAAGDVQGAARIALALSWDYEGRGAFAVSSGWLASAERILEGRDESPEHARLLLTNAMTAMFAEGDLPKAHQPAGRGARLARRVGDRDPSKMLALSGQGRALIKAGEIEKGLNLLDEATASAMCGDLGAHSAGLVYCITISSCQDLGDYRRAAESRTGGGQPLV